MSTPPEETQGFNLSRWALEQRSLVIFFMLLTFAAGIWSFQRLSRNEDPPFTIKTMVVASYWPGATAEDTSRLLTDKIEEKLEETPYLDRLDSYSRPGESVVFVNLREDAPPSEVDSVWYQVRKKVADIAPTLPAGVQGPFFDDEFGDTFGIIYGFTAEGFTNRELRDRLDGIRAQLLRTPDIGKVIVLGIQEEQIVLSFSPSRLAALGIDIDAVARALASQNAVAPAGVIDTPDDKVALRVSGAFASEASLREVELRIHDRNIRLSDLGTIRRAPVDPPAPTFRVNGEPSLGLAVSMAGTGNIFEFGDEIRTTMERIEGELPHGIEVTTVADQSTVVEDAVAGFVKVLLEAIAIVLVVSFITLGLRAGLVVTLSIPLVLAMTFVGMDLMGIGLQRISLGALIIALGLLVDDSMITVEAMISRLELGWNRKRAATFAYDSTAFPMLTGTLVMIAGFIPVGFAKSSAGEYCYSLFMVVLLSLLASWVVAVLFAPILGVWLLPRKMQHKGHSDGRLVGAYRGALRWLLHRPRRTVLASLGLLILGLGGATQLEEQFFPASDRPELLVDLALPQGASRNATERAAEQLDALLENDPDVDRFSTYVGSGAIRFYLPMDLLLDNDNIAQTVVVTKDVEARDRVRDRLQASMAEHFADYTTRVMPLELGPPVGWPLRYRVTGPDPGKVRDYAMRLADLVSGNPHTREVNLSAGEPQRSIHVELKQTEARAMGLSSQDVAGTLATLVAGAPVTTVRDDNRLIDVVFRADKGERSDPASLANLQISTPQGQQIPLRQIATVEYGVENPIIWKRQRQPLIKVQADVAPGHQPATVAGELTASVEEMRAGLPLGYAIEEGGAVEEAAKGNASVLAVVPIMLLVMITLLMLQLRSFSRMLIALAMAPFGIIGVVALMLPTGTPMGFVAQLGVIALAGMIIRNAVILIEEADANVAQGLAPLEAVEQAAMHRCRPIVLTACAAILGMVPIAVQVFWGPMAYAIIGGLSVATLLTLTLLPAILVQLLTAEARRLEATSTAPLNLTPPAPDRQPILAGS
ncbi:MAG: efflux RND transporter permease subunit [Acidobacteriota bacterium]